MGGLPEFVGITKINLNRKDLKANPAEIVVEEGRSQHKSNCSSWMPVSAGAFQKMLRHDGNSRKIFL